jgi:D-glycero-D-manno-heptose 1,7-bisphosphate phosphatase
MAIGRAAVFLDKDGTLIEDVPYNVDPARITLAPGAPEALHALQETGFALVVISNQSGAARGYFRPPALGRVEREIRNQLRHRGITIDGFYWCTHHPQGRVPSLAFECVCRKPRPGMLRRAASELGLDLEASWMVGDILNDVEAGRRAGCRAVLIDNGNETEWLAGPWREPDLVVHDLREAAAGILLRSRHPWDTSPLETAR